MSDFRKRTLCVHRSRFGSGRALRLGAGTDNDGFVLRILFNVSSIDKHAFVCFYIPQLMSDSIFIFML